MRDSQRAESPAVVHPHAGTPTHSRTRFASARRGSGCAEQWESRVRLPVAPCRAGRRSRCCCPAVLPGPSVVKQRRRCTRKRPTCTWRRWGVSNRSDPVARSGPLRRPCSPSGLCTTPSSVERSAARHARPALLPFVSQRAPISDVEPDRRHESLRALGGGHARARTTPGRVDGRAPARDEPAGAGQSMAVEWGDELPHHGIVVDL